MIVHFYSVSDEIAKGVVRAESTGDDGEETIGDMQFEMEPGETYRGVTFEQVKEHGVGPFEFPEETKEQPAT